jgi:hypothetical protein
MLLLAIVSFAPSQRLNVSDASPLALSLDTSSGAVTVSMNKAIWLEGGPTSVCFDGACYSSDAAEATGQLLRAGPAATATGNDQLGTFHSTRLNWTTAIGRWAGKVVFETAVRTYGDGFHVLSQTWPSGCTNCSGAVNSHNDVQSAFPTFIPPKSAAPMLNFLSWGGNQLSDSTVGRWNLTASSVLRANSSRSYPPIPVYGTGCEYTYKTHCPKWFPYFDGVWVGGSEHGAPLVLYDQHMHTMVMSPLRNFLVAEHTISPRLRSLSLARSANAGRLHIANDSATSSANDGVLPFAAGINGLVDNLPPGYTHESILIAGTGIQQAMRAWGDRLLLNSGKARGNADARSSKDFTLSHLGYWTDRGSYYYGRADQRHPGWTMQDSLLAVQADLKAKAIPVQYFQLDDW